MALYNRTLSIEGEGSKSFSLPLGYPLTCFTLNATGDRAITVSGKSDYELLHINDDKFISKGVYTYVANSRLNYLNIKDIAWSQLDESLAVSCGSNGELQRLIVMPSEIKVEIVLNRYHEKTINKVAFHPNKPNLVLTGCQDGTMKLIDFRVDSSSSAGVMTLGPPHSVFKHDSDEKVSDLQFNPSPSLENQFASGSETGLVSLWDLRNPSRYERKYKAHLGIVHLDWHPEEKYWLATASRDKQICVWDLLTNGPNNIYTLTHSESVSSIKWRPKRKFQIAACSSGLEARLYVWDLMRPYVPYASFDSLISKVQNFMWRNTPKSVVASVQQKHSFKMVNLFMSDAMRPANHSKLVAVEIDNNGSIAFAAGVGDKTTKSTKDLDTVSVCSENEYEKFRITKSILYFDDRIEVVKLDWFYFASTNYKFKNGGSSFESLCEHNAKVAHQYGKFETYKNWMLLKTIYKDIEKYEPLQDESKSSSHLSPANSKQVLHKFTQNELNNWNSISQAVTITNASDTVSTNSSPDESTSSSEVTSDESQLTGSNNNIVIGTAAGNMEMTDQAAMKSFSKRTHHHHHPHQQQQQQYSKMTNPSQQQKLKNKQTGYDSSDPNYLTTATTTTSKEATSIFDLENTTTTVDQEGGRSSIQNALSIEATTISTSQVNMTLHSRDRIGGAGITTAEDDEDYSILPNDVVEFNSLDDLVDFFNSSTNQENRIGENLFLGGSNETQKLNMAGQTLQQQQQQQQYNSSLIWSNISNIQQQSNNLMNRGGISQDQNNNANNSNINTNAQNNPVVENFIISDDKYKMPNLSGPNKIDDDFSKLAFFFNKVSLNDFKKMSFDDYFYQLLLSCVNDENDLTTAIFMFLVAYKNEKLDRTKIDQIFLDEWFSQYIELLAKFELWNLRIEIIKIYQSEFIKNLTQKSLIYKIMCAICKKTLKEGNPICIECRKNVLLCSYCHLPVKRLFAWCHNCCHGGHLDHMMKWFQNSNKCPTGCGCSCGPNYQQ